MDIFKCSHFWWQFFFPLNLTSAIRRHIYSTRAPSHTLSLLFLFLFALPLTLLGWVPSSSQWGRCVAVFYLRGTPFTLFHLSIGCFFIMHSWFSLSGDSSHRPRVSMETCDWPKVKGLWKSKWWILPCNEMCCCCSGVVYHESPSKCTWFSYLCFLNSHVVIYLSLALKENTVFFNNDWDYDNVFTWLHIAFMVI